jgi:drug/metabolite transporter (DMT)-like permease
MNANLHSAGPRRSFASDFLLLLLANAIWGSTDVVAKAALPALSPPALVWLRLSIALLAFSPALWKFRAEIPRTLRGLLPFLAAGACGFFLNFVIHYTGLSRAPAAHATALRVLEALTIFFLSAAILGERIQLRALLGLAAGVAGVLLVLDIDFSRLGLFTSGYRLGDLIIIAGVIVEGFYTIIGKRLLVRTRPLLATALACAAGWLLTSASFGLRVAQELILSPPPLSAWLAALYLALVATAFGYWMWYRVLSRQPSHQVGATILAQPVVGIPLAALVFHEPLPPSFLLGAALVALGGYLVLSRR